MEEVGETLRRLPFPVNGAPSSKVVFWPEVLRPYWEVHNSANDIGEEVRTRESRLRATPAQIERTDEALPWLYWVRDPRHRAVVLLRAMGHSWRRVSRIVGGCSHETARGWERNAIEAITDSLNKAGVKRGR